jgi:hypothetical protein
MTQLKDLPQCGQAQTARGQASPTVHQRDAARLFRLAVETARRDRCCTRWR